MKNQQDPAWTTVSFRRYLVTPVGWDKFETIDDAGEEDDGGYRTGTVRTMSRLVPADIQRSERGRTSLS
jgi:hypothetical protein